MISFLSFIIVFCLVTAAIFYLGQFLAKREIKAYKYVNVAGMKIHYQESGEGLKPIILVHGAFSNQESWDLIREELGQNYKIFSLDLPGMGESLIDENFNATPEFVTSVAEDLIYEFALALQIQRPHIMGSSMGGVIAASNFNKHKDFFDSCIMVSAPMNPKILKVPIYKLAPIAPALNFLVNPIIVLFTHYITARPNFRMDQAFAILSKFRRPEHFRYSLVYMQIILKSFDLSKAWARPRSTFYVWGAKDHLVRPKHFQRFLKMNPEVQFYKISEGTHHPMESHPKEFCRVVKIFLSASEKP